MAGPFSARGGEGQFDVAPVNIKGGFTPADPNKVVDAVASGIRQVGAVAAERFEQNLEEDIREQVAEVGEQEAERQRSMQLDLISKTFPQFADQLLAEDAKDSPIVGTALNDMEGIRNAMDQGKLPPNFAMTRLRQIQENAIEAAPEFADEIRAAVRDASGVNVDRVGAFAAGAGGGAQDPAFKAAQELQEQSLKTGLSVEFLQSAAQAEIVAQFETNQLTAMMKKGERLSLSAQRLGAVRGAQATRMFTAQMFEEIQTTGGIADPTRAASQVDLMFNNIIADVQANLPPGADPSAIQGTLTQLAQQRDDLKKGITDGNLADALKNQKESMVNQIQVIGMQNSPLLLQAHAWANGGDISNAVETISRLQSMSQEGRAISSDLAPAYRALIETEDAVKRYMQKTMSFQTGGNVAPPAAATSPLEEDLDTIARHNAMQSSNGEAAGKALAEQIEKAGGEFTWESLADRKVFIALTKDQHGDALENLAQSEQAALEGEFSNLSRMHEFNMEHLKMDGGQLVYQVPGRRIEDPLTGGVSTVQGLGGSDAIRSWVDKYNRHVRTLKLYADTGKVNNALWGGPDKFFSRMTQPSLEALAAERASLEAEGESFDAATGAEVQWIKDADGVFRPAQ